MPQSGVEWLGIASLANAVQRGAEGGMKQDELCLMDRVEHSCGGHGPAQQKHEATAAYGRRQGARHSR